MRTFKTSKDKLRCEQYEQMLTLRHNKIVNPTDAELSFINFCVKEKINFKFKYFSNSIFVDFLLPDCKLVIEIVEDGDNLAKVAKRSIYWEKRHFGVVLIDSRLLLENKFRFTP